MGRISGGGTNDGAKDATIKLSSVPSSLNTVWARAAWAR